MTEEGPFATEGGGLNGSNTGLVIGFTFAVWSVGDLGLAVTGVANESKSKSPKSLFFDWGLPFPTKLPN